MEKRWPARLDDHAKVEFTHAFVSGVISQSSATWHRSKYSIAMKVVTSIIGKPILQHSTHSNSHIMHLYLRYGITSLFGLTWENWRRKFCSHFVQLFLHTLHLLMLQWECHSLPSHMMFSKSCDMVTCTHLLNMHQKPVPTLGDGERDRGLGSLPAPRWLGWWQWWMECCLWMRKQWQTPRGWGE